MAAEAQWMFIADKYSLVEIIDSAIVVARFNQKELLRELLETRCSLLETKNYGSLTITLDRLLKINENITDERLAKVVNRLIDRISSHKDGHIEIQEKAKEAESEAAD